MWFRESRASDGGEGLGKRVENLLIQAWSEVAGMWASRLFLGVGRLMISDRWVETYSSFEVSSEIFRERVLMKLVLDWPRAVMVWESLSGFI